MGIKLSSIQNPKAQGLLASASAALRLSLLPLRGFGFQRLNERSRLEEVRQSLSITL